jgi:hypothetical protein
LTGNLKEIITRLEQQKAAIDRAIAALSEFDGDAGSASPSPQVKRTPKAVKKATKKRVMSEEGRRRIAEAQQKRWAKTKRAAKKLAKAA